MQTTQHTKHITLLTADAMSDSHFTLEDGVVKINVDGVITDDVLSSISDKISVEGPQGPQGYKGEKGDPGINGYIFLNQPDKQVKIWKTTTTQRICQQLAITVPRLWNKVMCSRFMLVVVVMMLILLCS